MVNAARGEAEVVVEGERRAMRLTLGALAELEGRLDAKGLAGLVARFEGGDFGAGDLVALLGAGLRGGGLAVSDEQVARMSFEGGAGGAARAAARLLAATFAPLGENG
ncbi:GTA-gp10 family protein [Albimonas sp. CAU 1670]|uniref:GTA-gp10 family protein n=1 Tax=Albimonas sp. CAU 1670 TaxID=3032599 RepID=UPI0023DC7A2B|nr:GTA-gp10 family protein [Albimonas sp. CAU 1670]MDF2232958.1 GTA-gp10 family protein [Albimonas sp. CAU 1670]